MGRAPWYLGVPSVEADFIVADGAVHRIAWRRGRLVLLDHPDPGGERCACFDVLDAWRTRPHDVLYRAREWSDAQAFGWPGPAAPAALAAQARAEIMRSRTALRRAREASTARATAGAPDLGRLTGRAAQLAAQRWIDDLRNRLLAMLAPALVERLACGLLVHDGRAGRASTTLPWVNIRDPVLEGLRACLRSWGPQRRPPTVDLDVWVTDEREPDVLGLVERDLGYVLAVLPGRWLVDVHARRLDMVDGCFVVDARLDRADAGVVDAVVFEHTGPWGWTPVRQTVPVARNHQGTWHVCGTVARQ
jgi:hypothetical protein